jgi:hypothetical protein
MLNSLDIKQKDTPVNISIRSDCKGEISFKIDDKEE